MSSSVPPSERAKRAEQRSLPCRTLTPSELSARKHPDVRHPYLPWQAHHFP